MPKAILANGIPPQQVSRQTDTPKLAAIYARVSTTDQADKGYSLPTQLEACQAMARQEGYTVPESYIFVDDYTGTSLNRPQFSQLRDLVRQRLVQGVFVYDLDRLSRKLAHQLLLSEECEQADVALRIVTMPDGAKTPEAQLLSNVRGIIAEYERAKILERMARGRVGRAKAGHVPGGQYTLGYVYVKHPVKGATYEVDPEEAALVQRIFRLYVHEGWSQQAIAIQLTREDLPTPADRRPGLQRTLPVRLWHQSTVARILRNPTYVGTLHYGKMTRIPSKQNPDKKTRWEVAPAADWIAIAVPPLIDHATFEAAQARRVMNAKESRRNRRNEYLFINGRLRCGQCGAAMIGQPNTHGGTRYRCCRGRYARYDVVASHIQRGIQASALEPLVWAAVERALNNPAIIAAEIERRKAGTSVHQADVERERQQYQRQLAQCDKDLKRWEAAYLGEAIDLADFKAKKTEVDARRASVEQELARLDAEQRLIEQTTIETQALMDYCTRVRQALQHFTPEEKRRAIEALNITVVWHPNKPLAIQGSIPIEMQGNTQEAIENHAICRPHVPAGDRNSV